MFPCVCHPNKTSLISPSVKIQLKNKSRDFKPGETIVGQVILTNDKSTELKNIQIKILGKTKVHFSKQYGKGYARHYFSEQTYISNTISLLKNDETSSLPLGNHCYPFSYTLGKGIPSSFRHEFGKTEYSIEALVKRPWYKRDASDLLTFQVQGELDLNNCQPNVSNSVEINKYKNTCNFFCQRGEIGFELTLPRTGFVPGEFITFHVDIFNNSKSTLKRPKASLISKMFFVTEASIEKYVVDLNTVRGPNKINPKSSVEWSGNIFQVPPVPPTRFGFFGRYQIIQVYYVLKFEIKMPKFWKDLIAEIPLTIGTIPLRGRNIIPDSDVNSHKNQSPQYNETIGQNHISTASLGNNINTQDQEGLSETHQLHLLADDPL